jgi:hypothetical protein
MEHAHRLTLLALAPIWHGGEYWSGVTCLHIKVRLVVTMRHNQNGMIINNVVWFKIRN